MSGSIFLRTLRGVALFVAGMVAAGTSISVAAPTPAAATTHTRVTSCAGLDFHPITSDTSYDWDGGGVWRKPDSGDQRDGFFLCDPQLPDKAVVTRLRFTVVDDTLRAQVRFCALYRQAITVSGANDPAQLMANAGGTDMAGRPGVVRLNTSTIHRATIDHASYGYYLQCQINFQPGFAAETQIIGADVTYRISSTNG
jgi:hypothetical protein